MDQDNQNPNSKGHLRQLNGLELRESKEAQERLDNSLLACFSVQKMYGRQPENIEAINQIFHSILAPYKANKVLRAFEIWMSRNQEFPTPSDIVSIIKRKGKPPLSREIYISISKKDPENRNHQDWSYMREYEAQANDDYESDFIDEDKQDDFIRENVRLRNDLMAAKSEINRMADLLRKAQQEAKAQVAVLPSMQERIDKTIQYMRDSACSEQEIDEFIKSVN